MAFIKAATMAYFAQLNTDQGPVHVTLGSLDDVIQHSREWKAAGVVFSVTTDDGTTVNVSDEILSGRDAS